jgi:hypothetical protein
MEVNDQPHTAAALCLQCPYNKRLNAPQRWFGSFGGEKKFLPLPVFKPRIIQDIAWSLY